MRRASLCLRIAVAALSLSIAAITAVAQQDYFSNLPPGTSPQEVGKRVAEHFVTSPHQGDHVFYGEVGTWYGALTFAHLTSDKELQEKLIRRFDPLLPGGADTKLIGTRSHLRSRFSLKNRSTWPTARNMPTGNGRILSRTDFQPRRATGSTTCTC
jgi:hypothetical protein